MEHIPTPPLPGLQGSNKPGVLMNLAPSQCES